MTNPYGDGFVVRESDGPRHWFKKGRGMLTPSIEMAKVYPTRIQAEQCRNSLLAKRFRW